MSRDGSSSVLLATGVFIGFSRGCTILTHTLAAQLRNLHCACVNKHLSPLLRQFGDAPIVLCTCDRHWYLHKGGDHQRPRPPLGLKASWPSSIRDGRQPRAIEVAGIVACFHLLSGFRHGRSPASTLFRTAFAFAYVLCIFVTYV